LKSETINKISKFNFIYTKI